MLHEAMRRRLRQLLSVLLLLPALLVSACASSEQVRERQLAAQTAASEEDDAKCKAQGAEPDTPAYTQCRDQLMEKRAEQQAADVRRRESFQRTLGEGTSGLSEH